MTDAATPTGGSDRRHESLLQFFAYQHLPPHLQEISKPFGECRDAARGEATKLADQFLKPVLIYALAGEYEQACLETVSPARRWS